MTNLDPRTTLHLSTALARSAAAKHWRDEEVTWGEVLRWPETVSTTKAGAGNYVFGELAPCRCPKCGPDNVKLRMRNATSVRSRSALTLDVDHPGPDFLDILTETLPWAALVHTTFSSTPEAPRYRVIIPLDRDVLPDEYHALASSVMELLGVEAFDRGSVEPWRYMFRPAAEDPSAFSSAVVEGPALPADELLADWDPDLSSLPAPKPHRNKRDPFELEGTVGAFNRAYADLNELIEAYELPYESVSEDRWQLAGTRSVAGVSVVAPGLFYSHHVTDPAHGITASAFDIVRLHRFGELDEEVPAQTPVNKRPSQEAMLELASTDVRVLAELVGDDFTEEDDDGDGGGDRPPRAPSWKTKLARNSRGTAALDVVRNWDLIGEHDPVLKLLRFNELTLAIETSDDLPWRPITGAGAELSRGDYSALGDHIEREYGVRPTAGRVEALVDRRAMLWRYNPIREYLLGLKWDGKPRVETALPGVRTTDYTRLVARKALVAAVARVLDPGVKWDHTVVLQGTEGLGKSYWVELMSRGYSVPLGKLGDKDTLLALQRSWLVLADEGFSLRKADADAMKEFLTRTSDVFRMPYDREARDHKRHCVIWATTNDETFLRREEGNRRFLIVKVERKVDFTRLTEHYIDQVWAEAVALYRKGERLYLTDEEAELAASKRAAFTEEDTLAGLVEDYLAMPVPEDWEEMSPEDRKLYRENLANGAVEPGPARINQVCSTQIWVEALGRDIGDHRRTDLLDITKVLKDLPDWWPMEGRQRVRHYGPQLTFTRLDEDDVL